MVLFLFLEPIIIHLYCVTKVCNLCTRTWNEQNFIFFPATVKWFRLSFSWKVHPEISDRIVAQLCSCAVKLSCQGCPYALLSSAAHVFFSPGFETTWPRLSCGQQIQLGRCSANGSHFSSGGENSCCAVRVSSAAGNLITEHAIFRS